jgi:TPR repeat protein
MTALRWVPFAIGLCVCLNPLSLASQNVQQQVEEGRQAIANGDYATALRLLTPPAQQGNPEAQNALGVLYSAGWGVPQDYMEAAAWFRKAAEQGHAKGQYNYGRMFDNGQGVTKDEAEAAAWYRKSAEQGYALGQSILGAMYATGSGVPQSFADALKWYRLAGEQGEPEAQRRVGLMYLEGQGVERDTSQARTWLQRSAAAGSDGAAQLLRERFAPPAPTRSWLTSQRVTSKGKLFSVAVPRSTNFAGLPFQARHTAKGGAAPYDLIAFRVEDFGEVYIVSVRTIPPADREPMTVATLSRTALDDWRGNLGKDPGVRLQQEPEIVEERPDDTHLGPGLLRIYLARGGSLLVYQGSGRPAYRQDVLIGVLVVKRSDRYAYVVAEQGHAGGKDGLIEGMRAVFASIALTP